MASPSFEPTETLTAPSQITYEPYNDTLPDRPTITAQCTLIVLSISRELSITYGNKSNIRPFVNLSSKQLNSLVEVTVYLFQEKNHDTLPDIVRSDVWGGIKTIDQTEMIELREFFNQMKSDAMKDPPIKSYFCPIQQQREVLASYTNSGTTTYKTIDVVTDYAICQNVQNQEPFTDEKFSNAQKFSELVREHYPLDGSSRAPLVWDIERLADREGFKDKIGISAISQFTANKINILYKSKPKSKTSSLINTDIDMEERVDGDSLI
ncbi:hypothetical protein V865_000634 [Kwoniella europaea PYCC6329]|uniref:Uncharacterized protein n=1 Tax=Kwoniella europaea PYCC6329 TaxID=1423913 RepID=A0AAX4K9J7_9TREE